MLGPPQQVAVGSKPRRGRPRSSAADRGILEATVKLMRRNGYAGMSIDAVAREAGVSKPTIYRRYPAGKSELACSALAFMRSRGEVEPTGDTRADLIAQLRRFYDGVQRPFGMAMIGTVLAEEHQHPELLERFREHVVAPRRRLLRDVLQAARDRGDLRAGVDIDLAITMMIGSYYAAYLAAGKVPVVWPEQTVDTLLAGLMKAS